MLPAEAERVQATAALRRTDGAVALEEATTPAPVTKQGAATAPEPAWEATQCRAAARAVALE